MRNTSLVFPFHYVDVEDIGLLFYPMVPVQLKTKWGWKTFDFLLDTGSDMTVLPSFTPALVGFSRTQGTPQTVVGIGGVSLSVYQTRLEIRIGRRTCTILACMTDDHAVPFLLGRKDVLDAYFSVQIDPVLKQTVFSPIKKT